MAGAVGTVADVKAVALLEAEETVVAASAAAALEAAALGVAA